MTHDLLTAWVSISSGDIDCGCLVSLRFTPKILLNRSDWRPFLWNDNGLNVCIRADDHILLKTHLESAILSKYPTRIDAINHCINLVNIRERDIDLGELTSPNGLILPGVVKGYLNLNELTSSDHLVLPNVIGGSLWLNGLTSTKEIRMPHNVYGDVMLCGITDPREVQLPLVVGGSVWLLGITDPENIQWPQKLNGRVLLAGATHNESANPNWKDTDLIFFSDQLKSSIEYIPPIKTGKSKETIPNEFGV